MVLPCVTVRLADLVVSRKAVTVTEVFAPTAKVVMGKFTEVWPAAIVATPGASATKRLLVDRVTEIPPDGAGALKKTVPVAFVPPLTLVGVMVSDCSKGGAFGSGATLTKIVFVMPPAVAITFPPVGKPDTGLVPMEKVFVLFPSPMVTLAGT